MKAGPGTMFKFLSPPYPMPSPHLVAVLPTTHLCIVIAALNTHHGTLEYL